MSVPHRSRTRSTLVIGLLAVCGAMGAVSLYRLPTGVLDAPSAENAAVRQNLHSSDSPLTRPRTRATQEHTLPSEPSGPDHTHESPATEGASAEAVESAEPVVYDLPNGLQVAERKLRHEMVSHEIVTYDVTSIEPDSGWDLVGLKEGDYIMSANSRSLGLFELHERINIVSDPDAELHIMVNQPDGGYYSVRTSLNRALEDGLPEPPPTAEPPPGWYALVNGPDAPEPVEPR